MSIQIPYTALERDPTWWWFTSGLILDHKPNPVSWIGLSLLPQYNNIYIHL
jgi:hypothetical protein